VLHRINASNRCAHAPVRVIDPARLMPTFHQ
jgi:hypothetical protein